MTTIEVLERALESLTEERWRQGDEAMGVNKTCLWRAVAIDVDPPPQSPERADDIKAALGELRVTVGLRPDEFLSDWQDAPDRTLEEVRQAVVETIARLKQENL